MLLPVPEVQVMTVLPSCDIVQIEAFRVGSRGCPFTADHDIVAWLVPEVIIVAHPLGLVFPTARNVELLVEEQKTARSVALLVTEHRDHNLTISPAVDGVRSSEIRLFLDLIRFDHLMQFGGTFIRDIHDVDAAGQVSRNDEKTARFAFICMARATGIPTK